VPELELVGETEPCDAYAFFHWETSGYTSDEPFSVTVVAAEALATAVVALTPTMAAPTQIILLKFKVWFLSDRKCLYPLI
jgi:hypothetical protein